MITTARPEEFQRYDIALDAEVVTLMWITNEGTYSATVQVTEDEPSKLRAHRQTFREYCEECWRTGVPPHEVEWDE